MKTSDVYGNTVELKQLWLMPALVIIFLVIVLCVNLKKITGQTKANDKKDMKIVVPLKYLWTLEIPLINCEINLIQTWSANCVLY